MQKQKETGDVEEKLIRSDRGTWMRGCGAQRWGLKLTKIVMCLSDGANSGLAASEEARPTESSPMESESK